jgi:hypothetical protein
MFVKPDGDYTGFDYQLPFSELTPTKMSHTSALYEKSSGAVREYSLPSGPATVSQSFRVEKFDDTVVRVQTLVQKQTKDVDAKISLALGDPQRILVSVKNSSMATISNMSMDLDPVKDGRLVGFDIATSGNTMKVYLHTKGDVITERSYSIHPDSQAPLASDGSRPMRREQTGSRALDKDELAKQGFFKARLTNFAGRREAPADAKPPRNLNVDGQK